jgi:hypothetical protein
MSNRVIRKDEPIVKKKINYFKIENSSNGAAHAVKDCIMAQIQILVLYLSL